MYSSPSRLSVTRSALIQLQRDEIMGKGVTAQATAGNPKRHTSRRQASPRARTNDARTGAQKQGLKQPATTRNTKHALRWREQKNGSTRTRPQTAGDAKKHPTPTGAAETNKATHTAPKSPECNQINTCDYTLTPGKEATEAQRPQPQRRRRANPRRPKRYLACLTITFLCNEVVLT